jgi:hypothetical protein
MEVQITYMENVVLRIGGALSLYWVKMGAEYKAAIIRRHKKKIYGQFISSWDEAKRVFTARVAKSGKRNGQRVFHVLSLYSAPDEHSDLFRCVAICRAGRKVVDVLHKERIGSIALAFKAMKAECGCRHRKRYDELDYHRFSTFPRSDDSEYAQSAIGRL